MTLLAVGFLLADAMLLGAAGFRAGRPLLVVWGAVFLAAAGAVLLLWRRYLRRLDEIARDRARLRQELRSVRPDPGR